METTSSSGSTILYLYLDIHSSQKKVSVCSHFRYYGTNENLGILSRFHLRDLNGKHIQKECFFLCICSCSEHVGHVQATAAGHNLENATSQRFLFAFAFVIQQRENPQSWDCLFGCGIASARTVQNKQSCFWATSAFPTLWNVCCVFDSPLHWHTHLGTPDCPPTLRRLSDMPAATRNIDHS